ncbi:MAG: gamma-glutamyl-gamma-aminobutyrate hydrolase family protein [Crocinitomicaceae bacterium]
MILIIDCGSNKTKYIEQIVYEFIDTRVVSLMDFQKDDLNEIQGVILSGAPILVTEVDTTPYLEKMKWILTTKLPVFGICFGHQLIGLLHGAFANRMREDRDWQVIESFVDSPLFKRLPNEFRMMEDHCEAISIPPGFELVASSDACVNEAMQHREKLLFGVQFHPEVSGNHGAVVLENFVTVCSKTIES